MGVTNRAGAGRPLGPRLDSRSVLGGAHSPQALGFPKQGQLVGGDVGVEEGEALQDALHQALRGRMLPESSAGLRVDGRTNDQASGAPGPGVMSPGPSPRGPATRGVGPDADRSGFQEKPETSTLWGAAQFLNTDN